MPDEWDLHRALREWQPAVAVIRKLLLADPASIRRKNIHGNVPLHEAAHGASKEVFQLLLDEYPGALAVRNRYDQGLIHIATRHSNVEVVQLLVDRCPAVLDERGPRNQLPMHIAAHEAKLEMNQLLADRRPEALMMKDGDGMLPFHLAVRRADVGLVRLLADKCPAAVETFDGCYSLPLHIAVRDAIGVCARRNMIPLIEELLDRFPKALEIKDGSGRLPLHLAFLRWRPDQSSSSDDRMVEVAQLLADRGPMALDAKDGDGRLPLHAAVEGAPLGVVQLLVDRRPDAVGLKDDKDGRLPLHVAAKRGNREVAHFLVDRHPEALAAKDKSGSLPLHVAVQHSRWEVAQLLLDRCPVGLEVKGEDGHLPGIPVQMLVFFQNWFSHAGGSAVRPRRGRNSTSNKRKANNPNDADEDRRSLENAQDSNQPRKQPPEPHGAPATAKPGTHHSPSSSSIEGNHAVDDFFMASDSASKSDDLASDDVDPGLRPSHPSSNDNDPASAPNEPHGEVPAPHNPKVRESDDPRVALAHSRRRTSKGNTFATKAQTNMPLNSSRGSARGTEPFTSGDCAELVHVHAQGRDLQASGLRSRDAPHHVLEGPRKREREDEGDCARPLAHRARRLALDDDYGKGEDGDRRHRDGLHDVSNEGEGVVAEMVALDPAAETAVPTDSWARAEGRYQGDGGSVAERSYNAAPSASRDPAPEIFERGDDDDGIDDNDIKVGESRREAPPVDWEEDSVGVDASSETSEYYSANGSLGDFEDDRDAGYGPAGEEEMQPVPMGRDEVDDGEGTERVNVAAAVTRDDDIQKDEALGRRRRRGRVERRRHNEHHKGGRGGTSDRR